MNLKDWKKKYGLRKIEYEKLIDIYSNFSINNNLNKVILDYPSNVRPLKERGLIKPNDKEIKKSLNWYDLTNKGKNIILDLK